MTRNADNGFHWYVAFVRSCKEKKAAEMLGAMACEYYLPVRDEIRRWSDRKRIVSCILIPGHIFIRCREKDRIPIIRDIPYIYGYLALNGPGTASVVRDEDMSLFRRMVEDFSTPVSINAQSFEPGNRVRIVRGPLVGTECELVSVRGRHCMAVRLGMLGTATMEISMEDLQKL